MRIAGIAGTVPPLRFYEILYSSWKGARLVQTKRARETRVYSYVINISNDYRLSIVKTLIFDRRIVVNRRHGTMFIRNCQRDCGFVSSIS